MSLALVLGLAGVVTAALWWVRRGERAHESRYRRRGGDEVDHDVLEEAEREVRDLGLDATPEEGFEGDDWGPGAPRVG